MTLQDSLNKLKAKIEGNMPEKNVAIMHKATATLKASGIENNILKVGDKAPIFTLTNQDGNLISSQDILKKGALIVTFYRGIWCPYCNLDLGNLKRYHSQLKDLGATMVSISPQLPEYNKQIVEQQRLNFDLLSDTENNIAKKFGLRWTMVNPLKSLYNDTFKINLPKYNGDNSWTLPVPARFIISSNGIIKYAEFSVDYTQRPNPDVLIKTLNSI